MIILRTYVNYCPFHTRHHCCPIIGVIFNSFIFLSISASFLIEILWMNLGERSVCEIVYQTNTWTFKVATAVKCVTVYCPTYLLRILTDHRGCRLCVSLHFHGFVLHSSKKLLKNARRLEWWCQRMQCQLRYFRKNRGGQFLKQFELLVITWERYCYWYQQR